MHLLVTGANGLLGSNIVSYGLESGHEVTATYHRTKPELECECLQLDVTEDNSIEEILDSKNPDVVFNCAAMTDVDGCETLPEKAHAANAAAPKKISLETKQRDISFVHFSTDYVFEGMASTPYKPEAQTDPLQVYGETKLAGELAVLKNNESAIVARLSFVYGRHGATSDVEGFPAWISGN
ncbi:SDR family oxidoreductase [Haladaptatus sp. GCM10025893]|uniref:SDR family oxidoreductase n=1 Tax=Haladaptatus sp. GCM10025893 TaxID=3252659 RepID=UPI0036221C4A